MPTTIWKYEIHGGSMLLPKGAILLCVQAQEGNPCLWAEVNPQEAEMVPRNFLIYGTGWVIADIKNIKKVYVGTYQQGPYVWHVYEDISNGDQTAQQN
jgi:hypothetical protein